MGKKALGNHGADPYQIGRASMFILDLLFICHQYGGLYFSNLRRVGQLGKKAVVSSKRLVAMCRGSANGTLLTLPLQPLKAPRLLQMTQGFTLSLLPSQSKTIFHGLGRQLGA